MFLLLLQGLNSNFASRELHVQELQAAARPLEESCEPEVVKRVRTVVGEAEKRWQETGDGLRTLCERYHRAVDLWSRYRRASDQLQQWAADQQQGAAHQLAVDGVQQVQVSPLSLLPPGLYRE